MKLDTLPRRPVIGVVLVLAALAAVAACVPTQVAINARFPANYPAAAELRRVAVAEFEGRGSQNFTAALRAELTNAMFDDQRYFTIFNTDAGVRDAVQAARHQGALAVIMGDTSVNVSQENFSARRRESSRATTTMIASSTASTTLRA